MCLIGNLEGKLSPSVVAWMFECYRSVDVHYSDGIATLILHQPSVPVFIQKLQHGRPLHPFPEPLPIN